VNYATENARVRSESVVDAEVLIAAVTSAGYTATVLLPPDLERSEPAASKPDGVAALRFINSQWLALAMAAPVAVWAAFPFHRAAWVNARHGATTRDTLISVGVIAAFGW
jgi:Cu+-exporting ATPase